MEEEKNLHSPNTDAKTNATPTKKDESIAHLNPSTYAFRGIRKRSFDDAQSRLKSRKILGLGGKESSKVLQVLGNCEHLETKIPDGLTVWLILLSLMFLLMSVLCLILFKPVAYLVGIDSSVRVTVMEVRLLGATFAGLAGLTWLTNQTSYLVLRNVLLTHLMYFGLSTLVFIRELFVEYNLHIVLALLYHFTILFITWFYFTKLLRMNQPIPDKPVSFAESDDNMDN